MSRPLLLAGTGVTLALAACSPQRVTPHQRVCGAFDLEAAPVTAVAEGEGPALPLLRYHQVTLVPIIDGNGGRVRVESQWFGADAVLAVATSGDVPLRVTTSGGQVVEGLGVGAGCASGGKWHEFPMNGGERVLHLGPTSAETLSLVAEVYDLMEVTE